MDPYILTKFIKSTPEGDVDPVVSLVIFEWKDEGLIGVHPDGDPQKVWQAASMRWQRANSMYVADGGHL